MLLLWRPFRDAGRANILVIRGVGDFSQLFLADHRLPVSVCVGHPSSGSELRADQVLCRFFILRRMRDFKCFWQFYLILLSNLYDFLNSNVLSWMCRESVSKNW